MLENRIEVTQSKQRKKKKTFSKISILYRLFGHIRHTNILIIRVQEGEENLKKKKVESIFYKIVTCNFPKLQKETDFQE